MTGADGSQQGSLQRGLGQTAFVDDEYSTRTPAEKRIVDALVEVANAQADTLPNPSLVNVALTMALSGVPSWFFNCAQPVLDQGGRGAEILREFADSWKRALDEARATADTVVHKAVPQETGGGRSRRRERTRPSRPDELLHSQESDRKRKRSPIESADEALKRQVEPELLNEILAGGAVAASFTAAASVAKAKIEATTQRQKNDLDAETERLKIASNERIAGFQATTAQAETEDTEPDST